MPIYQTRVNPLDLQKNIAIGISLPFNGPSGPFNSTYSTKEQIKYNLINLLLTNKGERVFNPEFGCDLKNILFEKLTEDIKEIINITIITSINTFLPEIIINSISIEEDIDNNKMTIGVSYQLRISGELDQITVEFI
jgi:phage baseplate assembly protein W